MPTTHGRRRAPTARRLVPYAYDPAFDEMEPRDAEDYRHDTKSKGGFKGDKGEFPWRGILNVAVLLLLILFISYPVLNVLLQPSERQHP